MADERPQRFEKKLKRLLSSLAYRLKVKVSKKPDPYTGRYVTPIRYRDLRPKGMSARQWGKLQSARHLGNQPEVTRIEKRHAEQQASCGHAFRETGVPAWRRNRRARSKNRCARVWDGGAA
jgi:hypothetical protein